MAHEFESGLMVRQAAWHGLGTVLNHVPNPLEAFEASELNWRVNKCGMQADLPNEDRINTPYYAIVRESDDSILGVVKGRWTPYQNEDAFAWTVPLVESGKWEFETAGSLKGGQRCWCLLKQGEVEIVPNDTLKQYLMVCWSHDGISSNYVQPTSIRVVCNNTLTMALNEHSVTRHAVRHSQFMPMRMDAVRDLYMEATERFEEQVKEFRALAMKKLNRRQIDSVVDNLFPVESKEGKSLTHALNRREIVHDAIMNGSGIQENGIDNTGYGVLMGISEATEHFIGGDHVKDRGANVLWGTAKKMCDKAFELVKAV